MAYFIITLVVLAYQRTPCLQTLILQKGKRRVRLISSHSVSIFSNPHHLYVDEYHKFRGYLIENQLCEPSSHLYAVQFVDEYSSHLQMNIINSVSNLPNPHLLSNYFLSIVVTTTSFEEYQRTSLVGFLLPYYPFPFLLL